MNRIHPALLAITLLTTISVQALADDTDSGVTAPDGYAGYNLEMPLTGPESNSQPSSANKQILQKVIAEKEAAVAEAEKTLKQVKSASKLGNGLTIGMGAFSVLTGGLALKEVSNYVTGATAQARFDASTGMILFGMPAVASAAGAAFEHGITKYNLKKAEENLAKAKQNLADFKAKIGQ